jgi:hypothetical protein
MRPDNTTPLPVQWDMSVYDNLVHLDAAAATAALIDDDGSLPPWAAAYPTEALQETGLRRQRQVMATVTRDVRYQKDKFVLLGVDDDSPDDFWVGKITKAAWVEQDDDGGDMAKIEVQWYVPVRGTSNYRGWLGPMSLDNGQPAVDVQDITSVIMPFDPKVEGVKVKVPAATANRVASMVRPADLDRLD